LPPYVNCVRVKGRPYYYYHPGRGTKGAKKPIRLPDDPRLPEWWVAYRIAAELPPPVVKTNTISALIKTYRESPEWEQLSASTKEGWSIYHRRIEACWGDLEVRGVEAPHVCALRDSFAKQPATANATLRCLSSLMSWSIPRGWRTDNPCEHVPKLRGGDPYEAWPSELVQVAETELRRDLWWAAGLALYSGQRQEDCLVMRWDAISSDGVMSVTQGKTGKRVWVPVHRELRKLLDEIPKRAVTILTSTEGTPWTTQGFKASWRKNLPRAIREGGYVFHGLRKSAVVNLLEARCTTAEVQAITGQSAEMVEHYAKDVNARKLAKSGMAKWENASSTEIAKPLAKPSPDTL
jgi:hypothetical protein